MEDRVILALLLCGAFIGLIYLRRLFRKLFGINTVYKGWYFEAFEYVGREFNLAELKLTYDERREKVAHLKRLDYGKKLASKTVYTVFSGVYKGININLLELVGSRAIDEIGVFADFGSKRPLWLTHRMGIHNTGEHKPATFLSARSKVRDLHNPIWGELSDADIQRLKELTDQSNTFEIIIRDGQFHLLIQHEEVTADPSAKSKFEQQCSQVRIIINIALELREMFEKAANELDAKSELNSH